MRGGTYHYSEQEAAQEDPGGHTGEDPGGHTGEDPGGHTGEAPRAGAGPGRHTGEAPRVGAEIRSLGRVPAGEEQHAR